MTLLNKFPVKNPVKKIAVSSMVAASLFVLPTLHPHKSYAADVTISTTHELLKVSVVNRDVKSLQTKLKSLNYYRDTIDGIYGRHTYLAVRNYQGDHHLNVDGIAGPNTLGKLFNGTSTTTSTQAPTPTYSNTSLLKYGSRGTAVKTLQSQLSHLGYLHGSIDGVFGPVTRQAVINFQKANGLATDGIDGPNTKAALTHAKAASTTKTVAAKPPLASQSAHSSTPVYSIIRDAKALQGVPYQWGGESPSGFDCSGFIQYIFTKNGVSIPRTASEQYASGKSVSSLQPGDLVFFTTYKSGPSHDGIYIGNNHFIHASSSHGVMISSLDNPYWKPKYLGAKRY